MIKLYACYEKAGTGWQLVVYHNDMPGKPVGAQPPERTAFYDVPEHMIGIDGSPNMGLIQKAFPKPSDPVYAQPPLVLNQEKEQLPEWAQEKSMISVIKVMQQLITRDGSRVGNATVAAILEGRYDRDLYLVVTDSNNWMKLNILELHELYEPGPYILKEFPNPRSTDQFNDTRTF